MEMPKLVKFNANPICSNGYHNTDAHSGSIFIVMYGSFTAAYACKEVDGILLQITSGHAYRKESKVIDNHVHPELEPVKTTPTIGVLAQVHLFASYRRPHKHEYKRTEMGLLTYKCEDCSIEMAIKGTCFHEKALWTNDGGLACKDCNWSLTDERISIAHAFFKKNGAAAESDDNSIGLEAKDEDQTTRESSTGGETGKATETYMEIGENPEETVNVSLSATVNENGEPVQITRSLSYNSRNQQLYTINGKPYHYACAQCSAQFEKRSDFEAHGLLHCPASGAVICGICGWFLRPIKTTVQYHRTHFHREAVRGVGEGEFNFNCSTCQAKFITFTTHDDCV